MLRNSYTTACGGQLVIPWKTREHLLAHPEVGELLEEVAGLLRLPSDGSFLATEVNLGRIIGRSGCVATTPITSSTPTLFASRVGRDKPSRVVVGELGPEVSTVVVLAFADRDVEGQYVLITSFVGQLAEKEPWDRTIRSQAEAERALGFWSCHALAHDPAVMDNPFVSTWQEILNS